MLKRISTGLLLLCLWADPLSVVATENKGQLQQSAQRELHSITPTSESVKSEAFIRLQQTLEEDGFRVVFQRPPKRNTYGSLYVETKTILINPVVFDLGNAEATLVHEAVHAAQLCASGQPLRSLGLSVSKDKRLRRFYLRYEGALRPIEAEAYSIQIHPQKVDQAIFLLQKHCS